MKIDTANFQNSFSSISDINRFITIDKNQLSNFIDWAP